MQESIMYFDNTGPVFGGNNGLWIYDKSNENTKSNSNLGNGYGKNEGAGERDLTKNSHFKVKSYLVY
jgi:hypothetical protein